MKRRVAFLLVGSALVGFAVAATKPPAKSTRAKASAKARRAKAASSVSPRRVQQTNPPAQPSDTSPAVDAASSSPEAGPVDSALPVPATKPSSVINTELGERDMQFLFSALEDGQLQLFLGELARNKADTNQVKAVGDVLASTQLEENAKLLRLATIKAVTLRNPDSAGQKAVAAKLEKLNGPKFEKMLLEEIIEATERAVETYEAAANSSDGDIKAFIEEGLPLAREKLLLANKISGNARRSDKTPSFRANPPVPTPE